MKSGRIIGIIGGILTMVGVFLPWATVSGGTLIGSVSLLGVLAFPFGILAMIFGIIGLILVAIGKRGMCIGALILGILAFIMILLSFALLSWLAELVAGIGGGLVEFTVDFGIYIAIVGSIILIIGSGLAMAQAEKPGMQPVPAAPIPPPQP